MAKDPSRFGKGAIEGVAGPEIRQQCRRANLVHSAPDAGHSVQSGHGNYDGRDDPARHPARPAGDGEAAGTVLGADRLDVARQFLSADHQLPLIGIWVKLLSVPYRSVPADCRHRLHRHLQRQNTTFDVWMALLFGLIGYFFFQAEAATRTAAARLIVGPLLEEKFAARALGLARRSDGVCHASHQRHAAGRRRSAAAGVAVASRAARSRDGAEGIATFQLSLHS